MMDRVCFLKLFKKKKKKKTRIKKFLSALERNKNFRPNNMKKNSLFLTKIYHMNESINLIFS